MNVHVSYKAGKTTDVEREFEYQLKKLEKRLQVFKPDLVHFHAVLDQENHHSTCVSLNLRLPSGQIAARGSNENVVAAVKAAFADLLAQVTKHKDLLRGHWTRKSLRRGGREGLTQMPPLIEALPEAVETGNRDARAPQETSTLAIKANGAAVADVEMWLSANLRKLEEFIDLELGFQVESERIREGQITRDEVLDEVIVSALSHEESRTHLLSLESWFHRLALQAVRRLIHANADTANISLDAPAETPNVTGSDENILQYHQPDENLREESMIRDENMRTPEEIMEGDEMVAQLDIVLQEVRMEGREAFVLFTLEGFTVEEISRLSGRPVDQVRESIDHARTLIQQKLPAQNQLRRSLLRHSRVA
jgi:DNA-directed RNA polymerase specialized sigma24 family protein/ribosome-associated translation inhibitor RaiA